MKVSGATFVRNAVKFDYPITESISSILPICDEFVVNVGESEDGTLEVIKSIGDPKLRIIQSAWDESLRKGGRVLSAQTDIALAECRGDWIFYIQADEVMHEKYLDPVRRRMETMEDVQKVQGLLFDFLHFYSSYRLVRGPGRSAELDRPSERDRHRSTVPRRHQIEEFHRPMYYNRDSVLLPIP